MRKTTKETGAKLPLGHPLYALVQEAYRVFRCAKPQDTGVCSCCIYPEIQADFFRPDIENLPLYYLRDWYFAAYEHPMPHALWAYMLPRVMEVMAFGEETSAVGIEVTFRAPTGDAALWTAAQWQVLERFQQAILRRTGLKNQWPLDDLICAFAKGGWSADALWAQVLGWPDAELVARLYEDWTFGCQQTVWTTAFWEGEEDQMRARYLAQGLLARIEGFAQHCADTELACKAIDVAGAIRRAKAGG